MITFATSLIIRMDIQILKLEPPFEYIYCNGEVGKHIATYIVGETKVDDKGEYHLETHSHPIVKYWNAPQGVVWNKAELTDCEVLCDDTDKTIDPYTFCLLCINLAQQKEDDARTKEDFSCLYEPSAEAEPLKEKLKHYGIEFKDCGDVNFDVEVGSCREGYFAQAMMPECLLYFNYTEPTLEELAQRLTEERKWQEEFFDHKVKIHFTPESSLAEGFVEKL